MHTIKNYRIIASCCALLIGLLLGGCKANREDFGHERVYLSQAMVVIPVEIPAEAGASAASSPVSIEVAGVTRSGEMLDPAGVSVEYGIETGYVEDRIAESRDPAVEMTDELAFLLNNDAEILPAECYEVGPMSIRIPSDKTLGTLNVSLKPDKIRELDPGKSWFLPAITLKSASIEINPVRERTLAGLKFDFE